MLIKEQHLHKPSFVIDLFVCRDISAAPNMFTKSDQPSASPKHHMEVHNVNFIFENGLGKLGWKPYKNI